MQVRWLEFLCQFDFGIKHIKDKKNKVTNALSRRNHVPEVSVWRSDLKEAATNKVFFNLPRTSKL